MTTSKRARIRKVRTYKRIIVASAIVAAFILGRATAPKHNDTAGGYTIDAEAATASKFEQFVPPSTEPAESLEESLPEITPAEPEPELLSLGVFRITAYCSCEKCCGYWAQNRPLDDDGQPIVYTASGAIAQAGTTIAADTDVLPFGTQVVIDGHTYTVQDEGSAIKGHSIDIYFEDHQEALEFGVKYQEIFKENNRI